VTGSKRRVSYVVNGCLASAVLWFVVDLSHDGRSWIDSLVIGVVVAAIVWNVAQVSRRLAAAEGGAAASRPLRTVGLWVVALFNTLLLRPEDVGSWRTWVGWAVLALAVVDTCALYLRERAASVHADDSIAGSRPRSDHDAD